MSTHSLQAPAESRTGELVVRLEPLREGYFPDLGEEPDEVIASERISPLGSAPIQRTSVHIAPASQPQARVPQRVFNEVLNANYEPSIAARLAARFNRGTPEFNEAYVRERAAQIGHAARPDPSICATGSAGVPTKLETLFAAAPAKSATAKPAETHNPWVLNRFADVFGIYGLGAIGWLAFQIAAAAAAVWGLEALIGDQWLAGGIGGAACFLILADWMLWLDIRGRVYTAAVRPALIVLCATMVLAATAAGLRILTTGALQWGTSTPPSFP